MLIAEAGLIKGERIGVDASTMEANAALRNIVRRDNGEGFLAGGTVAPLAESPHRIYGDKLAAAGGSSLHRRGGPILLRR